MTSRTRLWVLVISTPVIAFALIGGLLGKVMARDETYQHLRIFQEVVSLVVENYVEPVDVRQAMRGAMRGLAEGLDPESAYLTPELVKSFEANTPAGPADLGLDLSRQYYLRIVSVRPGRPRQRRGCERATTYARLMARPPGRFPPSRVSACCRERPDPGSSCSSSAAIPPILTRSPSPASAPHRRM